MHVVVSFLLTISGLVALPVIGASVAAAAPPAPEDGPVAGLEVVEGHGPQGMPFAGEAVLLQSPAQWLAGTERGDWTCQVDLGSGPQPGYWRAKPGSVTAPCAYAVTFAEPGTVMATMTVSDPQGRTVTTTREITVTERHYDYVDAGAEGTSVPLPAAPSGGTWVLYMTQEMERRCSLVQPEGLAPGSIRCFDEDSYRLHLNAVDGSESRGIDVRYANAAPSPAPAVPMVLTGPGYDEVPAERVLTGDRLLLRVAHGDPGAAPDAVGAWGDVVTCAFDMGEGTTEVQDTVNETCYGHHAYQTPGTFDLSVTATDDDGASGSVSAPLEVVYRYVALQAAGALDDGSVVSAAGSLERTGPVGALQLDTGDGRAVRQAGPLMFGVTEQDVSLEAPVTLDGRDGYRASVTVSRVDGSVVVVVWSPSETAVYATGAGLGSVVVGEPEPDAGEPGTEEPPAEGPGTGVPTPAEPTPDETKDKKDKKKDKKAKKKRQKKKDRTRDGKGPRRGR